MTVDFGRHSDDYAVHRPGFPDFFYDRLEAICPLDGVTALDVGTGPGIVALELAKRGARVTGIDISPEQIEAARGRAAAADLTASCEFRVAPVEQTAAASESVDLVTAGQCWTWFDHDRALSEVERVLVPGGFLVVAHYCYLAHASPVAARTEELILQHNPGWTFAGMLGLYPSHVDAMQTDRLRLVEQFCRDHDRAFTHTGWRGRIRTCNGVGSGALTPEQVAGFDAELAALLEREFPEQPLPVAHRVWATIVRKNPL